MSFTSFLERHKLIPHQQQFTVSASAMPRFPDTEHPPITVATEVTARYRGQAFRLALCPDQTSSPLLNEVPTNYVIDPREITVTLKI